MNTQLEAIVLKNFDYQDHHKIVKMISPSHGLIGVFIGYANKKKSRYRALAEPLTCVTVNVRVPSDERGGGGLYHLVHGDVSDNFYELKVDYEKIMMFYEMAEVIIRGDIEKQHLPYAYRALKEVLSVAHADEMKFRLGVVTFKAKMIIAIGLLPAIDSCVGCQTTRNIITASVDEGGLLCESCYSSDGLWLSAKMIPLWRALFKSPIERLIGLDVDEPDVHVLEIWIKSYYERYSHIRFSDRLTI